MESNEIGPKYEAQNYGRRKTPADCERDQATIAAPSLQELWLSKLTRLEA